MKKGKKRYVAIIISVLCVMIFFTGCNVEYTYSYGKELEENTEDCVQKEIGGNNNYLKFEIQEVCKHKNTTVVIVRESTCKERGQENIVCNDCEEVVATNDLEFAQHTFSEYILQVEPTPEKNGVEVRYCSCCFEREEREYVCTHKETSIQVQKATCKEKGFEKEVCDLCNTIVKEQTLDFSKCSYGDWIYTKEANPLEEGERYRKCSNCDNKEIEKYTMSMAGDNSIYITGTDINASFVNAEFTQDAIDKNDIVYSEDTGAGSNNPFILGHKHGTLKKLSKTKVGESIYVSRNGVIEKYEVVVSEYGVQNESWTDIVGEVTATSIWKNFGCKTLHLYTCYGKDKNGRWMVLATKQES